MKPAYDDGTVRVYHAEHAALAEHLRETGERPDALIGDPPYSDRTHAANDGSASRDPSQMRDPEKLSRALGYACWSEEDVSVYAATWFGIVAGWCVVLTDNILAPVWQRAAEGCGRYAFSPIACVQPGSRVRLVGDGPAQWSVWAMPSRPRSREWLAGWRAERASRGQVVSLPGAYVVPGKQDASPWMGGKPERMIRALVNDYSAPGDLIVDPTCGAGTLGVAVRYEGRRAILADKDPAAVECTIKRLRGERTKPTRDDYPETDTQPSLFAREAAE